MNPLLSQVKAKSRATYLILIPQMKGAMRILNPLRTHARAAALIVIAAGLVLGLATVLHAAPPSDAPAAVAPKKADAPVKKKKAVKLTGAQLYQINCNRCHPERYPTEFSPAQWKTIVTHMRVRANLPAQQAREILKYLQEDSGN